MMRALDRAIPNPYPVYPSRKAAAALETLAASGPMPKQSGNLYTARSGIVTNIGTKSSRLQPLSFPERQRTGKRCKIRSRSTDAATRKRIRIRPCSLPFPPRASPASTTRSNSGSRIVGMAERAKA